MAVSSQGKSSSASSENIAQGVLPPLTANVNFPRAETAARARSAISSAACLAMAAGSVNTSTASASPMTLGARRAVTTDEGVGGTVVVERRFRLALQLGDDALG